MTVDTSADGRTGARIGLLGGTFDPPHVGHLMLGACALADGGLDQVRLVVANDPWQKSADRHVTPATHRLAMVDLAIGADTAIVSSSAEIERGGPSYSIDTIEAVHAGADAAGEAEPEVVLVVGSDVVAGIDTWHRADELRERADLLVARRPGSEDAEPPSGWTWTHLDLPRLDVSGTELRDRLQRGRCVDYVVPRPVVSYIGAERLYR